MIADKYLEHWDAESIHQIAISGESNQIYDAVRELDFSQSILIRLLFMLRGLPSRRAGLASLEKLGFTVLEEQPHHEFVIGIVGRFWTVAGHLIPTTAKEFLAFSQPGFARTIWNFVVQPSGEGITQLKTITRVQCLDQHSRRRFMRYWRVIGPFSGLIRSAILRLVKKQVESNRAVSGK